MSPRDVARDDLPPSLLDAALRWAARGFRIFPVAENGKVPAFGTDWRAIATTDPAIIRSWWRDALTGIERSYNVGVAVDAGSIVADLDRKNNIDGVASWQSIGGSTDDTLIVETPSGGWHCYYSFDRPAGNSASKLAPGIDTRGHGGYCLAPGSVIDGREYRILHDKPIAPLPPEIAERLAAAPVDRREQRTAAVAEPDQPDAIAAARSYLRDAAPAIQGNGGDARTFAVACEARDRGVSAPVALELMVEEWNDRCEPPWPIDELREKVANAYQYAQRAEGEKSAAACFGQITMIEPTRPVIHAAASRLRLLSVDECVATETRPYVVKGLIAAGQIGCAYGLPGSGKSVLLPHLGYLVAQGARAFGRRTRAGAVVYAAAEDQTGMRARVAALRRRHGAAGHFHVLEGLGNLNHEQHVAELIETIAGLRPALVVLDTLAASFPGLDENSSADMSRVVAVLHRLAATGTATICVHHSPKSDDATPRGHSVLNGALDLALHVVRTEAGPVMAKLVKNRSGPIDAPIAFRIDVERMGFDSDGDAITAPIAVELDGAALRKRASLPPAVTAARGLLQELAAASSDGWVADADWCAECVQSDAVSKATTEEARQRVYRRVVKTLTDAKLVEIVDGAVRPREADLPDIAARASAEEVFADVAARAAE